MHHFVQLRTVLLPGWRHSGPYIDFQQKNTPLSSLNSDSETWQHSQSGGLSLFLLFQVFQLCATLMCSALHLKKVRNPLFQNPSNTIEDDFSFNNLKSETAWHKAIGCQADVKELYSQSSNG